MQPSQSYWHYWAHRASLLLLLQDATFDNKIKFSAEGSLTETSAMSRVSNYLGSFNEEFSISTYFYQIKKYTEIYWMWLIGISPSPLLKRL